MAEVAYSLLEHGSMMCCILAAWCDLNILVPPSVSSRDVGRLGGRTTAM